MNRHHLILGMGKTGQSVARYLSRLGLAFAAADTR
jgi:UDP-N-acetylmuramoylalanine-D-glutamate ligase